MSDTTNERKQSSVTYRRRWRSWRRAAKQQDTDQCLQSPCSVRKRFSRDHCCRGRSKPGCRIVGSHTRWELTTWADFQLYLHRLLMSTGRKSSHSGFLDVSRSNGELRIWGWIGQLSCLTIFSTSLSVAAFLRTDIGYWLLHTCSVRLYISVLKYWRELHLLYTWKHTIDNSDVSVEDVVFGTHFGCL